MKAGGGAGEDLCSTRPGPNPGREGRGQGQPDLPVGARGTRVNLRDYRQARRRIVGGSRPRQQPSNGADSSHLPDDPRILSPWMFVSPDLQDGTGYPAMKF
jgi:hypothetical protein